MHAELGQDALDVGGRRLARDAEQFRDVGGPMPLDEQ
jgi:hypothetical protein